MIKGLGVDIIEISRIHKAYVRFGKTFLNKIYSQSEQEYCLRKAKPAPSLAARFCVKEAVAKALGVGLGSELAFSDIEVLSDTLGKPFIRLSERAKKKFNNPQLQVSLSHCQDYATATVIWMA